MAGAEAVPLLAKLHAASFDVPWTEQDFAALLGMPGTAAHIVTLGLGMEPVAFAVVRSAADEAEILTLATLPELRRTGRASALLLALKSSLGKEGITALHIEVAARNTAAIGLYRKSGFRESGRRKLYYALPDGKFDDAILMRLDLKP
jgi:ribosomal-protein-alanine N-acetyltransferase